MFSRFVFSRFVAVVSMVLFFATQMPYALSQSAAPAPAVPTQNAARSAAPAQARNITLPAGTSIALTLINPVRSKSSKPGDAVRATVAFPVTAGTQVAIPAGTYAQGTIETVNPRAGSNKEPQVKIHFTSLLFANGYSVPLDAENTEAELDLPATATPQTESAMMIEPSESNEAPVATPRPRLVRASYMMGQEPTPPPLPPLPPLPQVGPSPAVLFGATAGGAAAFTIGMLIWAHHRAANLDYVLFDTGWQFQIVLDQPLTIDASRISALATVPAGN